MPGIKDSNCCEQKTCRTRVCDRSHNSSDDANSEVHCRPILYTGVVWIGILRRFLIPRTCGSSLPPLHQAPAHDMPSKAKPSKTNPSHAQSVSHALDPRTTTETQLTSPLLLNKLNSCPDEGCELRRRLRKDQDDHFSFASIVVQIQETSAVATELVRDLLRDISGLVKEGRLTTSETLSALRSEEGVPYRWAMITLGGVAGYLAGLRRGTITRVVYLATGASAMATICYPYEAQLYNSQGLQFLRQFTDYGIALIRDGSVRGAANGKGICKEYNNITNEPHLNQRKMPNSKIHFKQESPPTTRNSDVPISSLPPSGNIRIGYTITQTKKIPNQEQTSITEAKEKILHTNSSCDSSASIGAERKVADVEPIKKTVENHSSNLDNHLIPVPEPALEIEEEMISCDTYHNIEDPINKVHPLNKKLSRYYIKSGESDESISSSNKGYEDLYTKRKLN